MNLGLSSLVDPETRESLQFLDTTTLVSSNGKHYSIIKGIPRFVPQDNYAQAFGKQWNRFPKTQLDTHTGLRLSEERLERCMQGELSNVRGKMVLEAGSGAGRFTEILLKYGAIVHSFDYSNAVEANAENNGHHANLTLAQADIRRIPFPKSAYDYVICLGVLQHTPDPEESIRCLWEMVKPGGALVIDHYRWKLRNFMPPPIGVAGILYRQFILRRPLESQFSLVKKIFDFWFPTIWRFRNSRIAQFALSRFTPIVMYYPHFGLRDRDMYYEWMLLDTHDAMTDTFKHRRTIRQMRRFLEKLTSNVTVTGGGNGVEAFCRRLK